MANISSMSKVRAASGVADHVFSNAGNVVIIYAIAMVTGIRYFGQLALLLTLLAAVIAVLRGALGAPLLCTAGRGQAEIQREASFAITTALLVSLLIGGVMWAAEGSTIRLPAMLIIVAIPAVLVKDVLRYVAIAQGRPHIAALWDGLWFAGSAALLVASWLQLSVATTTNVIAGWTALAFIALIGMLAGVRVAPSLGSYRAWISDGWQRRIRYGLECGLAQTTLFAVLLFAAVLLSPVVTAALAGATALLAPVVIAASSIRLADISVNRRPSSSPSQLWDSLARIALVTASASLLIGGALFLMPLTVGETVLGRTFVATQPIILIIAFDYAIAVWIIAVAVLLRTFNRTADARRLEVGYVMVTLGAALGSAMIFGTAAGVAAGMATATTFVAAVALLRFKPWATLNGSPRRSEGLESVAPDLPRASAAITGGHTATAGDIAAHDFLNVGMPGPIPLATRLRLHEPRQVNGALITLWSFATLAVFVPAAIIRFTGIPNQLWWLWSLPMVAICAARFSWLIGNGERRLFELMFWGYSYAFLCLAPLAQLRTNDWPETVPRVDVTYTGAAALMVIVGCCAFLAGAGLDNVTSLRRCRQAARRTQDVVERIFTINYKRTVLLCAFAILLNIYYLSHVGWIQLRMSRYEAALTFQAVWPPGSVGMMVQPCSFMALLVAFIALMRFRKEAKMALMAGEDVSPTVMRSNMALAVIIGMLLANSMNPISNARYLSGTAILAAGTAFGLFATKQRFRLTACGFLIGLLVIFPLADAFRVSRQAELKAANPIESLLSDDYDSFAQLMNGYLVGAREGIVPGKQFSGVLLFWLPRTFWTNKPVDTGIYIANVRGYRFTNLSAPLWIEFYLNGGWVLLAVGMFALGFGLHRWDTRLNAQLDIYRMPGLLACILPFYLMILLRGSLLQAASYLFFTLMFSAFVQPKKARTRPRAPTVPPEPQSALGVQHLRTDYVRA